MRQYRGAIVKLVIFAIVSIVLTTIVTTTTLNANFTSQKTYHAVFDDVSGLHSGDTVRVAGVGVGKVTDLTLRDDNMAEVTFSIDEDQTVTNTTIAAIRYENLLGQRYLALQPGDTPGDPLPADRTIAPPLTRHALDLTALFNGFRPLFQALTPDDVNKLANLIVQALQGEGGALDDLIAQTASLTSNLANRDEVIASVIDHLASFLQPIAANDTQLANTITSLQQFATAVASDRDAIFNSLQNIDSLASTLGSVLQQGQPALDHDIAGLKQASDTLVADEPKLDQSIRGLPPLLGAFIRTLDYGSFGNVFFCNMSATTDGGIPVNPATFTGIPALIPLIHLLPPATITTIPLPNGPFGDQSVHSKVCS